jgi:GntR family transcriptional regulator, transcriptional repressor for pyruvate dehydrogenase complex
MDVAPQRKLRRRRLSEELTAQLRKHIIEHGLKPGDPLLTEQEMVERFGVSRSVVREATKALDFLGIIDAVPRRGMILDQFDFNRVSEYFGFHFALSDYPKEKLLKARAVIETGALHYVAEAMQQDPAVYDRLQSLAEAAPDTVHADDSWIKYDIAFHRGLVEATDITPLASFCDLLQAFFHKFRAAMSNFRAGRESHCQIVAALHTGELEKATALLREHLRCYEDEQTV